MALPDGVTTVTVTGTYEDLQGDPCPGTVTFTPPCRLVDSTDDVVLSGPVTVVVGLDGTFSVTLPCTDNDKLNPSGFTYRVTERLTCSPCPREYDIALPCGTSPVDIATLVPVDTSPGVIVIRGPQGEPGSDASTSVKVTEPIEATGSGTVRDPYVLGLNLSTDAGNELVLGTDSGLFAPEVDGSETVVQAGTNTTVTGSGTAEDPYVISSSGSLADTAVAAGDGLVVTGSGVAQDPYTLAVVLSTDADNTLSFGTDHGLFVDVPAYTAGDGITIAADTISATGTPLTAGTAVTATGDPTSGYTVGVDISTDPDNALTTGTDEGLFVQAPQQPSVTASASTVPLTTTAAAVPLTAQVNTDPDTFTVSGTNITVAVAGIYLVTWYARVGVSSPTGTVLVYARVGSKATGAVAAPVQATYLLSGSDTVSINAAGTLSFAASYSGTASAVSLATLTLGLTRLGDQATTNTVRSEEDADIDPLNPAA